MTERLTPRVGDRVIVSGGGCDDGTCSHKPFPTSAGNVRWPIGGDTYWVVELDGSDDLASVKASRLTVVDREPVEWPRYPMWRYGDYSYSDNRRTTSGIWGVKQSVGGTVTVINESASAISADDARKIGEAWLKVAEHWDELTR